jgi:hypothetical protein
VISLPANYVLLNRIELNDSAASVTFANIPQSGYTDLKIVTSARSTSGASVAYSMFMRMNNLTTSIYSQRALEGSGSAASSFTQSGVDTAVRVGLITGTGATASTFSNSEILIPNYTSANNKSVSIDTVAETNATTQYMNMIAYLINSTAAITDLTFSTEPAGGVAFAANSTFSLYGLAAVGTEPVIAPKATGGNIIANDGTYWIHTFTSTGTFTPLQGLSCDYLVVAGGGGGGDEYAGGGGAGGLRSTVTATGGGGSLESALSVASGTAYTITVGAGGAGSTSAANKGTNGSNSVFSTITATGGGGGGSEGSLVGANGGSGGGGSYQSAGGTGTSNQGYAGGSGSPTVASVRATGGGGGGAGAVGANAPSLDAGGNGGNGVAVSITGTSVTYAGGGGGGIGTNSTGSAGTGGTGGGGAGAKGTTSGSAATINTGGGGGGAGGSSTGGANGGAGGSGIVIIRYPIA